MTGLPELTGSPICVYSRPQLTAHRGKLLSCNLERGRPVHAASFIRRREIVLETELLAKPHWLCLIFVHELFHFVWPRLPNEARREYGSLLEAELKRGARGELGESSDLMKSALAGGGSRAWADYLSESFCDTAACLYAGVSRCQHWTLAPRWLQQRESWFDEVFSGARRC